MKKFTLTQKVILIFLIVIIPITILLSLSTDRSKNVIREEVSKSNSNLLTIYMNKIDEDLESIETYLYKMISSHSHIYTDDYKAKNYSDYILSLLSFKKQLLDDSYLYPFVDLFFIYDAESNEIIETSNILNNDLTGGNTLKDLVIDKGPIPWTVIYKADSWLLIKMMNINQTLYLGSCFRINKIMPEDMTFSEGALVGIMDDNGMLLAGDKSIREVLLSKNKKDNSEDFDVAHDEDLTAFLLTTAASQDSPLTLMLAYPEEGMLRALHEIQRMQYLAPVLIMLTLLLYIYLLKTTLIKPINIIEKSMKSIGAGKWETRIEEDWSQEFSNIAEGFNEMVDHIHSLKIAMYDEQIKVQKAEYRYLQMQINPHFYMNTLNVIYNMAALKDYENVQKLSIYLSNHFRYIMKSSQKLTTLNDEIEHTKNYLEIHKVRFGDNLNYEIQVHPSRETYYIPSLTIQTFVENSIIHGFVVRNKPFYITIRVRPLEEQKGYYELVIQDTGRGFPEDFLDCFRKNNFDGKYEGNIGIQNTIKRLSLRYENKEVMELKNAKEGGAIVRVILPIDMEGELI